MLMGSNLLLHTVHDRSLQPYNLVVGSARILSRVNAGWLTVLGSKTKQVLRMLNCI